MVMQEIMVNDVVELSNGKTGKVISVDEKTQECTVQLKTQDGLEYERKFSVNHVKKVD